MDHKDADELEIEIIDENSEDGVETSADKQKTDLIEADNSEIEIDEEEDEEEELNKPSKKNKTASYIEKLKAENKKLKSQMKKSSIKEDNIDGVSIDRVELLEFKIDNPEAGKYMDDIKQLISENPNLGLQRAYALIKAEKGESQTVSNFSISNKRVIKKKLSELTQEEAISKFRNDPISYNKWRKAVGL